MSLKMENLYRSDWTNATVVVVFVVVVLVIIIVVNLVVLIVVVIAVFMCCAELCACMSSSPSYWDTCTLAAMLQKSELNVSACKTELWICNEPVTVFWGRWCVHRIDKRFIGVSVYWVQTHISSPQSVQVQLIYVLLFFSYKCKNMILALVLRCVYVCMWLLSPISCNITFEFPFYSCFSNCCFFLFRTVFVSHRFIAYIVSAQFASHSVCFCQTYNMVFYVAFVVVLCQIALSACETVHTTEQHFNFWKNVWKLRTIFQHFISHCRRRRLPCAISVYVTASFYDGNLIIGLRSWNAIFLLLSLLVPILLSFCLVLCVKD